MGRLSLLELMDEDEDFMVRLLGREQWRRIMHLRLDPHEFFTLFEPQLSRNNLREELRAKALKVASPEWEHPSLPMPFDWDYKEWYEALLRELEISDR